MVPLTVAMKVSLIISLASQCVTPDSFFLMSIFDTIGGYTCVLWLCIIMWRVYICVHVCASVTVNNERLAWLKVGKTA